MRWAQRVIEHGFVGLVSVGWMFAACGDDDDDCDSRACRDGGSDHRDAEVDASVPTLPRAAFFLARARAYCGGLMPCCEEAQYIADADVESCAQHLASEYRDRVEGLATRYDPAAGARCVAAYGGWLDDCHPIGEDAVRVACRDVFVGMNGAGASCRDDFECAPIDGLRADCRITVTDDFDGGTATSDSACVVGQAAPEDFAHARSGEPCFATCRTGDVLCLSHAASIEQLFACFVEDELHCSDGVCQAPGGDGAPCANEYSCASGFRCDFEVSRCVPFVEDGERCTPVSCGLNSLCWGTPDGPRCGPKHGVGEVCDTGDKCLSGNCNQEQCVRPSIPGLMDACFPNVMRAGFWHF